MCSIAMHLPSVNTQMHSQEDHQHIWRVDPARSGVLAGLALVMDTVKEV
jgi:hypothetical protein